MTCSTAVRTEERLAALERYHVLGTGPEERYDRITRLAARLFDAPIALVSLVGRDRQWFKSRVGTDLEQTPLSESFCVYAIEGSEGLVVEDAREDPRFAQMRSVTGGIGIRFYAGAPLTTPDGHRLGTLCLIDTQPRPFSEAERRQLADLAAMVVDELELRRENALRREREQALAEERAFTHATLDALTDVFFVLDAAGRLVRWNRALNDATGRTDTDLDGMSAATLFTAADEVRVRQAVEQVARQGRAHLEAELVRTDGRLIPFQLVGARLGGRDGQPLRVCGIGRDLSQLREIEQARHESDARWQALAELQAQPLLIHDRGEVLYGNEAAVRFGEAASIEELVGTSVFDILEESEWAAARERMERQAAGVATLPRVYACRRPSGERRFLEVASTPVLYQGRSAAQLVMRDVTDKRQAAEALRRSEERLRIALQAASMGTWDWDLATDRVVWSEAARTLLGLAEGADDKAAFFTVVHPGDRERLHDETARALDEGVDFQCDYRVTREGAADRWLHSRGRVLHGADGRPARMTGVVMDITERKQSDQLQQLFGYILDRSANEIYLIRADTLRFVEVSAGAVANLGYRLEELRAMTPMDLALGVTDDVFEALAAPLRTGREQSVSIEAVHRRKDGTTYPVEVRLQLDTSVEPGVFVALIVDITDRQRYEQQLISAKETAEEMSRLKSAFLANMSHEIRTPLTSILGFSELLADHVEGDALEFAQLIHRSGDRLMQTLTSVLDLAQLESRSLTLAPSAFVLQDLARDVLDLFQPQAAEKGLRLVLDAPAEPVAAMLDNGAVTRVLTNLVSNAIKFTDEGAVTVGCAPDGAHVRFWVTDTGIGIDAAFLAHVFDEFKQESEGLSRRHEGSGLGLTITQHLVEIMGGTIEVASRLGAGSTFTVRLPANAA